MVSSSTTKTPTPKLFEKDHVAIESSIFIQISFNAIFKATKVSSSYQLTVYFLETALKSASETAKEIENNTRSRGDMELKQESAIP